jgi:hypothetical protein
MGYQAGEGSFENSYDNVVLIGYQSGNALTTGSGNVFLGYLSGSTLTTESNRLYIENSASTSPLIYGEFDNDVVTINGNLTSDGAILTTNGTYDGSSISATVAEDSTTIVVLGDVLYQESNFSYKLSDADSDSTMPVFALALETGDGTKKVLLKGQVCNTSWSWSAGLIYADVIPGGITQTEPSDPGDQQQILGFALSATTIWFEPNLKVETAS